MRKVFFFISTPWSSPAAAKTWSFLVLALLGPKIVADADSGVIFSIRPHFDLKIASSKQKKCSIFLASCIVFSLAPEQWYILVSLYVIAKIDYRPKLLALLPHLWILPVPQAKVVFLRIKAKNSQNLLYFIWRPQLRVCIESFYCVLFCYYVNSCKCPPGSFFPATTSYGKIEVWRWTIFGCFQVRSKIRFLVHYSLLEKKIKNPARSICYTAPLVSITIFIFSLYCACGPQFWFWLPPKVTKNGP